jgi:hypothetical protein
LLHASRSLWNQIPEISRFSWYFWFVRANHLPFHNHMGLLVFYMT